MLSPQDKIAPTAEAFSTICSHYRKTSQKVVLTTGAYDIIHKGHVRYLWEARRQGDVLVLGINSDGFIRFLKGEGRPVNPAKDRAIVVAALAFVDLVYVFREMGAGAEIISQERREIIELARPDVFVMSKSSHSSLEERREQQELVRKYGGKIVILEEMAKIHTTDLIKKTKDAGV